MISQLFEICCERDPDPDDQRRRILKAIKTGDDVLATDKNGVTALHHAVRFRSPIAVKTLIENGAIVNLACRRNGSTPLHRAVTQSGAPGTAGKQDATVEIVQLLIEAGANSSTLNKSGKSPLDYASDERIRSLLMSPD